MRLALWAALLVAANCAQAQFSNLAVTDDASQVYFATNLRLVAEASQDLPTGAAIYRIANGVIERVTVPARSKHFALSYICPWQPAGQRGWSRVLLHQLQQLLRRKRLHHVSFNQRVFPDSAWPALRPATDGRGADQPKRPLRLELSDDLLSIPAQPDFIQFRDLQTEQLFSRRRSRLG